MDNRRIDVTTQGRKSFGMAMELVFAGAPGGKATHFAVLKDRGLVLAWSAPGFTAQRLPYSMTCEQAAEFAWGWLSSDEARVFLGSEPDYDGDNGAGFRVYNEDWGRVAHDPCAFVAILPVWAMYGK